MVTDPPSASACPVPAGVRVAQLNRAVLDLDQRTSSGIVADVLRTSGVVEAWTDVIAPALRIRGDEYGRTAGGVNVEHLLTECTRTALSTLASGRGRRLRARPVLLAAPDGEQHVLALHALAAALTEVGRSSVLLGASVPERALTDSVRQLRPSAVFLWSSAPETARVIEPAAVRRQDGQHRDDVPPVLVLGGPGWPHASVDLVGDLAEALRACTAPIWPSRNQPPLRGSTGLAS